jgi:RNA polymerase sigma-70 factor (ECF subfamily)
MLADDVRLELVAKARRSGRAEVSQYFTNYASKSDWRLEVGQVEGREVILVYPNATSSSPAYFVELTVSERGIEAIKDFRYVPYILKEATR